MKSQRWPDGRAPIVLTRLEKSVSKYVLKSRFSAQDRTALKELIDQGRVELFDSPTGRAYRLKPDVPTLPTTQNAPDYAPDAPVYAPDDPTSYVE